MRATLLACAWLAVASAAHAQTAASEPKRDPAVEPPTFRTGVRTVRVDVTVSDRNHQPVSDLTADDFEVREDGVPQRVESVQFIRLTGFPPADSDESLAIRSPEHAAQEAARDDVRLLVIFIDDYHLSHGVLADVRRRRLLRRFVLTEMKPLDLFAVMGPLTPMSHLRLTRDRQALLEEIEGTTGRRGGFVAPRSPIEENHSALPTRDQMRVRAQVTFTALESLVVHLSGLRDGRKSILFVSEGPPLIADRFPLWDRLEDVVTAANTGNVTIHTLDPRDLGSAPFMNGANQALSAETGGRRLAHSNDYTQALKTVIADASAYYLLGYTPDRAIDDGQFHEIDVRVRRKGVRVLARKGYWAPTSAELHPQTAARTPPEIARVLTSLELAARPQVVADWVGVGPVANGRRPVTVICAPASNGEPAAVGSVTIEVLGEGDRDLGTYEAARAEEDVWLARFEAGHDARRIRIAVADSGGEKLDAWFRPLEVSPRDGGAIGTPLVFRPRTVAAWRELLAGGEMVPEVDRRFRRTDRVVVRLPVTGEAAASGVEAELVNRQGETLLRLPVETPGGRVDPQVELPIANLAQADYVLRLTATANGTRIARLVPFAVVP